ncbi:Beta-glucuronidase [Alternaria arborescens]|uniref:Beta-glucuronidase n=1 Tax=Alternaria arborescens TaxID=156630 RepID=A0A4Q4R953_9PLEO|nr:Beta-glucuronidase [Alternaria arborescens]
MVPSINRSLFFGALAASLKAEAAHISSSSKPIAISKAAPNTAGIPLDSFVSFSFEFSSWPDFAGNLSHPNAFTYNLMSNLGKLQGSLPIARVGGNTQDIAIFDESQKTGLVGVIRPNVSADYPTIITIGPSYFESYKTMPKGTKFVHGFNMGANSSAARAATWASVSYACKAIGSDLLFWEYGNEPDLFHASGYRPDNWTEADYVSEWLNGTTAIEEATKAACPDLGGTKFMAPSFAGVARNDYFTLDPVEVFRQGLDEKHNIGLISSHNYMGVSTNPGITLQGTLMNHSSVVDKANAQLNVSRGIKELGEALDPNVPFIMGEHNSLARQGRPGLSNSFGAALWGVDWNVYLASQNLSRSHMHQGTNYRYQSWQPIETNITTRGTKPPYYGNLAVAAFMHKPSPSSRLQISSLASSSIYSTQYAAHVDDTLARLLLVDLHTYNTTTDNNYTDAFPRPSETYSFQLPRECKGEAHVQRLLANGSDAISGITWDGYSYNYELDEGKPVRLGNVTCGESVKVDGKGMVSVEVPWSSAAIVSVDC